MEKVKVLWIDDDIVGTRLSTKNTIERQNKDIEINLIKPPKDLKKEQYESYDVVLIDERLGNSLYGSQIGLPISFNYYIVFIISEVDTTKELKDKSIAFHTGFIEFSRLNGNQDAFATLLYDLKSLKLIKSFDTKNLKSLLRLPEDALDNVYASLPSELKGKLPDNYIQIFFHFLFNKLFLLSGEFIDSKNLSAKLGLRLNAFEEKISPKIKDTEYKGIFHKSLRLFPEVNDKLWVIKELDAKLFSEKKIIGSKITDRFNAIKLLFPEIEPEDYAKCFVCKKDGVEILARDPDNNDFVPAHYRCTIEDDSKDNPLYFDENRVLIKNGN